MDQSVISPPQVAPSSIRPAIRCGWLLLLTLFLVLLIHGETWDRKRHQRTFAPSPPLLPAWVVPTVDNLLWLQLALLVVAIWCAGKAGWSMIPVLLGLTFLCLLVAGNPSVRFG